MKIITTSLPVFLNRLCPRGTTFKRCGSACENSCNNFCTRQCVIGCFCPPEQIKVGHKCLPREAFCATQTTTPPTCPKGQAWNDCGTLCDNQCPGTACKLSCEPGCYCPRGTQKVISEDNIESCEPLDCKCKDSDEDTEVPEEHLKDFYGTF